MTLATLLFLVLVSLVVLAALDVFWPSTVALAVGLALAWWWGYESALWELWQPWYLAGYIPIGLAWVFFRWTRLVDRHIRAHIHMFGLLNEKHPLVPPRWSGHWTEFTGHFFYWPLSMLGYLFSDMARELWRYGAKMVSRSFDRYAEWRVARTLRRLS